MNADITLFDIEMAPALMAAYGPHYEPKVMWIERDKYLTCFAYKILGRPGIVCKSLRDYPLYKKEPHNDRELARDLYEVMKNAPVLCAYNGNSFDIKEANAIFARHKFPAISEEITIDPYKEGKKRFRFTSHKLDYLAEVAGIPGKHQHGIDIIRGVVNGDLKACAKEEKYCMQDVRVLEGVYLWMRPWMKSHPNMNVIEGTIARCPRCLSKEIIKDGYRFKVSGKYQRYRCQSCAFPLIGTVNLLENRPLVK